LVLCGILHSKAKQETPGAPKGKVGQIRSANMKLLRIFFIRCASPIGGV
jgi:hypothetical protein